MKKVTLYYGPKREFARLLPNYNLNNNLNNNLSDEFTDFELERPKVIMTISELAILSDKKMREHVFQIQTRSNENKQAKPEAKMSIDALIAWSDQYAALSESAVQGFLSFIDQYNIQELYLQNPPKTIAEQLIKSQEVLHCEIKIFSYKYNSVDLDALRQINLNYANYIIGQEQALQKILLALYPLTRENYSRPAVLLFYGSTGVGKTETANFLSKVLKQNLFRRQLSMFNSSEFAAYLFGGRHSQNSFAKDLMERESNIILLDEFDKIAPAYHTAFYQMFDEGIYDDKNYAADLRRTVIICTSNYKSEQDARDHIAPALFARFDAVIKFNDLDNKTAKKILGRELQNELNNLDEQEREYIYKVQDELRAKILNLEGSSDARDLKRRVKNIISQAILDAVLN